MTINLHKDLASSGWHSSIVTTYSVDPAFYDTYVERRLRTHGVKNNILMADARMLKMALNALPEAFSAAGVRYAVVPVSVGGAFHPKVHLRLGENKARLVIGSANATAAGWGKNQEVVTRLNWNWRANDVDDNGSMGPLIAKTYSYLERWLINTPGEAIRYKLQMMERQAQWLREIEPSKTPITLSDGSAVDLLCEAGGDSPSMLKQFSELASQEKVSRLVIVSPYWDQDLRGLTDLRSALGKPATFVALNPHKNSFPIKALRGGDTISFVAIDDTTSARFLHAKIIIAQTSKADHILFGSANCSDDALGHLNGLSRNAEVSVYRRLPPGYALQSLTIDLAKLLSRDEILPPIPIATSAAEKKSPVPAGVIELRGQAVSWWPPSGMPTQGATIELFGVSLKPRQEAGGKWAAEISVTPIFPLIARVRYRDDLLSDPVIVHSEMPLRKAAPGQVDPRLNEALDKARGPDGDLMELAAQAHVIFEPAPRKVASKDSSWRTDKPKDKDHKVIEYESEKDFRNAMEMQPGTGRTGRTDENDPSFQDLLAIIGRGIAGSLVHEDPDDDQQDAALLAGDAEDDADELQDPDVEDDEGVQKEQQKQNSAPATKNKGAKVFTTKELLHRRQQLVKALDLFDAMLVGLKKDPSLITSRVAVQTMFVFRLMRYACSHIHKMAKGEPQKLMVMSECDLGADRRHSFVFRSAWALKQIWTGSDSIASRIRLDSRQSELPDDIFGFIVVSRWALARAYLEATKADEKVPGARSKLVLSLGKYGKEIYAETLAMGRIDALEEAQTIAEMDSDLGYTWDQTEELIRCLRNFDGRSAEGHVSSS
jgi:hypothetical protein